MHALWKTSAEWFKERADGAYAKFWLAVLSFTEASIFIVPPDPLLAAMVLVHKGKWLQYSLFTTLFSVFGAAFGYVIGAAFFEAVGVQIIEFYGLVNEMQQARTLVNESVFIFTLTAAFTPIPFKVAVLAAGFMHANFALFIIAAAIGRTARYGVVALAAKLFGEHADVILKRFWWIVTIAGLILLLAYGWYVLQ